MTQWEDMLKKIDAEFSSRKDSFLRQPTIARTIHPHQRGVIDKYHNHLKKDMYCVVNLLPFVKDPQFGAPFTSEEYSLTTIQHCHYLNIIKKKFSIELTDLDHISEIGGGYGNFYRMAKILGFKGSFEIADFPLMHKIQKHYLENTVKEYNSADFVNLDQLSPNNKSLLIGIHSINEMPMSDRQKLEKKYNSYDYIVIAHNDKFDGIDNIKYFRNLKETLSETFTVESFHCPVKNNGHFLVAHK